MAEKEEFVAEYTVKDHPDQFTKKFIYDDHPFIKKIQVYKQEGTNLKRAKTTTLGGTTIVTDWRSDDHLMYIELSHKLDRWGSTTPPIE